MKAKLLDNAPPGTVAACHPSEWIQSKLFVDSLLLLDGHTTHTRNLPLIEKERDNGMIILSFLPHCTHKMKPLNISFTGPLNTYYSQEKAV